MSLGDAVGRPARPVSFVVSMGLGTPPSTDRFDAWLALYPELKFKLDANVDWTDDLVARLEGTGAIDSIDLKGQYRARSWTRRRTRISIAASPRGCQPWPRTWR